MRFFEPRRWLQREALPGRPAPGVGALPVAPGTRLDLGVHDGLHERDGIGVELWRFVRAEPPGTGADAGASGSSSGGSSGGPSDARGRADGTSDRQRRRRPRFRGHVHDYRKRLHAARPVRESLHHSRRSDAGVERCEDRRRVEPALQSVEREYDLLQRPANGRIVRRGHRGQRRAHRGPVVRNDDRRAARSPDRVRRPLGVRKALHVPVFEVVSTLARVPHRGRRMAHRGCAGRRRGGSPKRSSSPTIAGATRPESTTTATEAQSVLNLVRTQDFDPANHIVQYYAGAGNTSEGTDGSYMLPAYYQT